MGRSLSANEASGDEVRLAIMLGGVIELMGGGG